ncbi:endonuclease domain-containing protein, partial [Nostoc sp. PCC 9305]|uniref:endonuclease domain-containing protein n=1 Tax=Nostoc sp. PCC 9305 TaxID=296636 RepID=UPI0039C6089E
GSKRCEATLKDLCIHRSPEGERLGVRAEIAKLAASNRQIPKVLLERARKLRKQQTPAEEILWECLRNRRLLNTKFRRQHNIGRYITDFYCHEKLLIIELDGSIHANQQSQDFIRENWLKSNKFTVIHFSNEQIFNDIELVLHTIAQALTPSPQGSRRTKVLQDKENLIYGNNSFNCRCR